ncbi:hypothetical protein WHR41_06811 [Cladosporium halotolerans]|uniref:Copper transport protein n=1 Tax=Cladosporium halotolerans TaxID=1052096 RepID=A0AB34KGL1_9PEZI
MDHAHHAGMDHSHMDHGDMGHDQPMCSMNMLFTWDTTNLCIVFPSWRVTGTFSLIWSLIAVIALTAGYEAIRDLSRRYEERIAEKTKNATPDVERNSLLATGNSAAAEEKKGKTVKAALYGIQVFYSFFIMLLFMTYNGWVMLAVGVGAFLGYLMFGGSSATKSAACH